jgi:hypothetical protein
VIENIDEFIHVGGRKWDVIFYDGDPIYDIEGHFQLFPSQPSYEIVTDSDIWKQGDDIITDVFQTPKDDLMQCSHNDFWSYLEEFDEYSFEHLDIFYEEEFQPPLCSFFDKGEDMVFLKQDTCDEVFQPPSFLYLTMSLRMQLGNMFLVSSFLQGKSFS